LGCLKLNISEQNNERIAFRMFIDKNCLTSNFSEKTARSSYEITDHLGNVHAVISDRKLWPQDTTTDGFQAEVLSRTDYYPFGMEINSRSDSSISSYGFNGMLKNNEVSGSGNHIDFGARGLDVRLGRWWSTDAYEKLYAPISSYVFSLNNPLIFRDADGNVVVGADGKAVTYTKGKNGQINWSSNATADVKRMGNAMLKTKLGTDLFNELQVASHDIHLKISQEPSNAKKNPDGTTSFTLGSTKKTFVNFGDGFKLKEATITINENTIKDLKERGIGEKANKFREFTDDEEAIGVVAGHEAIHASDDLNIQQSLSNKVDGTDFDVEGKPNSIEDRLLNSAASGKLKKIKMQKTLI